MTQPIESETRRRVREMTARGLSPREIATLIGISTQAVYKQLRKIQAQGDREEVSA